ncbi:C45 family peptidase [Spirosoma arcticum]
MKPVQPNLVFALAALLNLACLNVSACSMCKVTTNGRTYLGNNEDSWRIGAKIWFEKALVGKLGALYVGYANLSPQGGMNQAGLAFDGLTIHPQKVKIDPTRKTVTNFSAFIKHIMQTCRTVDDVRHYAIQFNRQGMREGELLFADKSGRYLVMEPDTMIIGNDKNYIIANFCPSITSEKEKLGWGRYRRGREYISNHQSGINFNYCLALVDTMHECRPKLGDGTMYSSIADLQNCEFTLYFYHDYKHELKFNLEEELFKGDHVLDMVSLFPNNSEYENLMSFKVPQNDAFILMFLYCCGVVFLFSSLFFLVSYVRNRKAATNKQGSYIVVKLLLFPISIILLHYVSVLIRNQAIFYFPAPYQDSKFSELTIAAYIPFLLLLLIFPLAKVNLKLLYTNTWQTSSKLLITLNNLIYVALILLFAYWGFYDVF